MQSPRWRQRSLQLSGQLRSPIQCSSLQIMLRFRYADELHGREAAIPPRARLSTFSAHLSGKGPNRKASLTRDKSSPWRMVMPGDLPFTRTPRGCIKVVSHANPPGQCHSFQFLGITLHTLNQRCTFVPILTYPLKEGPWYSSLITVCKCTCPHALLCSPGHAYSQERRSQSRNSPWSKGRMKTKSILHWATALRLEGVKGAGRHTRCHLPTLFIRFSFV